MQVGTTKDNKPSAAVHPGALAAGTLPQCNTRSDNTYFFSTATMVGEEQKRSVKFVANDLLIFIKSKP